MGGEISLLYFIVFIKFKNDVNISFIKKLNIIMQTSKANMIFHCKKITDPLGTKKKKVRLTNTFVQNHGCPFSI